MPPCKKRLLSYDTLCVVAYTIADDEEVAVLNELLSLDSSVLTNINNSVTTKHAGHLVNAITVVVGVNVESSYVVLNLNRRNSCTATVGSFVYQTMQNILF